MPATLTFDAIVVGSGISGGWAAKELTERGLRTVVLEAGPPVGPADYVEHVRPHALTFRGLGDRKALERDQPVQRECWACDEYSSKFFVNDRENPYTTPADAPFRWFRGRQVGGRSLTWTRQVYRWSDLDFEANARDGNGNDWPIRYADIAPWYSHVERFIGVSGAREGLAQLPDGEFLKPMDLSVVERHAREKLRAAFDGTRILTIGRTATLTEPHGGRAACHYCGPCHRGCATHSYFSSIGSTLPAAAKTGRLTLMPNAVVAEVLHDPKRGRARGVRVIDAATRASYEVEARVVFLCASAIESVRILLNSRSGRFPDGLGASSGTLGRYVMDHNYGSQASGRMPGFTDRRTRGNRPNVFYIPRFQNLGRRDAGFLRGYALTGSAGRATWSRGSATSGYGAGWKHALIDDLGPWTIDIRGWAETLPHADNRITLDPAVKDKWGIPVARLDVRWRANERALSKDIAARCTETLDAVGCDEVREEVHLHPPGYAIHEMGGARMSRTSAEGVLNRWNQLWDAPNVFVTDGAAMASSACQNPSITYMALTARAAAHAVEELKQNAL